MTIGQGRRVVLRGQGGRAEGSRGLCRGRGKRVAPREGVILLFWSVVTTDRIVGVVLGAKRVVL